MKQRGFTLLETLVALVLMSLLLLALFGGFRAGIASWRIADDYVEETETQLMLSRLLYRQMNQLKIAESEGKSLLGRKWSGGKKGTFFLAQADVLQYIAPLGQAADNQLYLIELRNGTKDAPGLWVKMLPYDAAKKAELLQALELAEPQLLSSSLQVRFSYQSNRGWLDELPLGGQTALLRVAWLSVERSWASTTYRIVGR